MWGILEARNWIKLPSSFFQSWCQVAIFMDIPKLELQSLLACASCLFFCVFCNSRYKKFQREHPLWSNPKRLETGLKKNENWTRRSSYSWPNVYEWPGERPWNCCLMLPSMSRHHTPGGASAMEDGKISNVEHALHSHHNDFPVFSAMSKMYTILIQVTKAWKVFIIITLYCIV